MAIQYTPALGLPYPEVTDTPKIASRDLRALAQKMDSEGSTIKGSSEAALTASQGAEALAAQAVARANGIEDPIHVGPTAPAATERLWVDTVGTPALKAHWSGAWETIVVGRDGPQGIPGPASPHEGSHIAVSARQYGAVGDGATDDTAAIQAAIAAAGLYGYVDFEAGTYLVTGSLGMDFWRVRKAGQGVITDGQAEFRISPRNNGDVNTIWVSGAGSSQSDGLSPSRPLASLTDVANIFQLMGPQMLRGVWRVRLSGTIQGGGWFQTLPAHKVPITFEGDPLVDGTPTTWIEATPDGSRIGLRFDPAPTANIKVANLGFRGFNSSSGYGILMKSGGYIDVRNCETQDCSIGYGFIRNVSFYCGDSKAICSSISGTRAQYSASGTWDRVTATGGQEGFHVSRNAVTHIDRCVASDNTRDGVWVDMNSRASFAGSTAHRNGREGIRGEGGAEILLDSTTYGPFDLGTGTADANTVRGLGLYGAARTTRDTSIIGLLEYMVDRWVGSRTSAYTAQRGHSADRVGAGARIHVRAWGTGAGSVSVAFASTNLASLSTTGTWVLDLAVQHDGQAWQGVATVNGGAPVIVSATRGRIDSVPTVTPTSVTLRGVETYIGG